MITDFMATLIAFEAGVAKCTQGRHVGQFVVTGYFFFKVLQHMINYNERRRIRRRKKLQPY